MINLRDRRIVGLKGTELTEVSRQRPIFEDVSEQVGIRLNRSTMTQQIVQTDIDGNRVETMGLGCYRLE